MSNDEKHSEIRCFYTSAMSRRDNLFNPMTSVSVIRSEVFTIPLHDCTSTNICLHGDFSSRLVWFDIDKQLFNEKSCVQTRQAWEPNNSKLIAYKVSVDPKGIYQTPHCMFHIKNFAGWGSMLKACLYALYIIFTNIEP